MAVSHTMTREDFEHWLNDKGEEVIDQGDQTPRGLGRWMDMFVRGLQAHAAQDAVEDEGTDDAFGARDELDFGGAGDD